MNKGNLNKLVTNYPVELTEEEIANLSGTLAPVIAACGGGGGTGGKIYTGIGFVSVNNSTNQIGLTEAANTKLNQDIPTKVSDLTDSANYQTVEEMANYETTQHASQTYLTKSSADTLYAPLSTTADIEALKAASGDFSEYYKKNETYNKTEVYSKTETSSKETLSAEFDKYQTIAGMNDYVTNQQLADTITNLDNSIALKQNKLTFEYDSNNAISSIDGSALAGQGGKTYTPGQYIDITNDEISVTGVMALDEYAQYEPVLMGDANITATSSKVDNHTQWNLAINSTPVVTDTTLKGENVVTAHTTQVSGEWAVGLVQSAYEAIDSIDGISTDVTTLKTASGNWNKVSAKLDTTAFSTVSGSFLTAHQSLEDYATKSDINDMATQTWVSEQGFYTKASGDNDYAPKSVTGTVNTLTGASAGWNEVTAKLDKSIYSNASGNWEASYNVLTSYSAAGTWLTAHQSLTNYYTKSETSGASEIENALTGKQDKLTFAGESNTITSINNSAVGGGTSFTGVTTAGSISGDGLTNPLGLVTSAEQALSAVANKLEPPPHNTQQSTNYIWSDPLGQGIPGWIDANNWLDEALENTEFLHAEDLRWYISPENGVSGKWDNEEEELKLGIDTTNMAANKQYAFTTTGWAEVQAGTSFTGVVTGTGLSGTGLSNSPLGIDTGASIYFTNGSAKSAISADKAVSASASKRLQDSTSGPVIQAEDVTALQNWASSNSSTWEGVTAKLGTAQYALDSATFYTTSNTAGYLTKTVADTYYQPTGSYATSAGLTAGNQYAMTTNGWASVETAYLPLTGGTVTGQMTLTGTGWDNRLTIGRSNTAIDIGVASNGALTLKANINNACQFNMMQTGTSGVDINITYGQTPTAIGNLYVMKTHTIAEATTASGSWNGDNLLHIILDS